MTTEYPQIPGPRAVPPDSAATHDALTGLLNGRGLLTAGISARFATVIGLHADIQLQAVAESVREIAERTGGVAARTSEEALVILSARVPEFPAGFPAPVGTAWIDPAAPDSLLAALREADARMCAQRVGGRL